MSTPRTSRLLGVILLGVALFFVADGSWAWAASAPGEAQLRVVRIDLSSPTAVDLDVVVPGQVRGGTQAADSAQPDLTLAVGASSLPVTVTHPAPGDVRLALVLDESLPDTALRAEQLAARELLLQLPQSVLVSLVTQSGTSGPAPVSEALAAVPLLPAASAPVSSAHVAAAVDAVRQDPGLRAVVVVLGRGWASQDPTWTALSRAWAQAGVTLHAVTVAGGDRSGPDALVDAVGGYAGGEGDPSVVTDADRIADDVLGRYTLHAVLPDPRPRTVHVSVGGASAGGVAPVDVDLVARGGGSPAEHPATVSPARSDGSREHTASRLPALLVATALLALLALALADARGAWRPTAGDGGRPAAGATPAHLAPAPTGRRIELLAGLAGLLVVVLVAGEIAVHDRGWSQGSRHGPWQTVFDGYGRTTGDAQSVSLSPQAPARPQDTHAALVTTRRSYDDVVVRARLQVQEQLRPQQPNPWEVGWLLWHYTSAQTFYALTLKPTGWELSKQDPDYPGGQRFLASGTARTFPIGSWHSIGVVQVGDVLTVSADEQPLTRFTDTIRPYLHGGVGLYSEDARVRFEDVQISAVPAVTPLAAAQPATTTR